MYTPDYSYSEILHQEHLREAEELRAHSQLVKEAMEYRRAQGEEDTSLLTIIAQRLHLKAQRESTDARQAHAN